MSEENKPPVLCKDCRHFSITMPYKCLKTETDWVDLVMGEKYYESCCQVRSNEEKCGRDAKWFEAAA